MCRNWVLVVICWADVYETGSSPGNVTGAHPYPWSTVTPARQVVAGLRHLARLPAKLPGHTHDTVTCHVSFQLTCRQRYWGTYPWCTVTLGRWVLACTVFSSPDSATWTHTRDMLWHLAVECLLYLAHLQVTVLGHISMMHCNTWQVGTC